MQPQGRPDGATVVELGRRAAAIRRHIIGAATERPCAVGGALSAADIIAALYFDILTVDPSDTGRPDRDYFILSKGHSCLALFAALAERGFIPASALSLYEQSGGILAGHPTLKVPGVDLATGSLGHGLSVATGLAVACKASGERNRVFIMMGDGELQEGSVWEAAMSASRFGLDNLVAIIDRNGFQAFGEVEKIMPLEPLADKWRSFGWHVIEINGNDMEQVVRALHRQPEAGRPTLILARTIKGKGVPCLEDSPRAHFSRLTAEEGEEALRGLTA